MKNISYQNSLMQMQYETQHWLEVAFECQYLDDVQFRKLLNKCEALGKMINNMIQKSNQFVRMKESTEAEEILFTVNRLLFTAIGH